MATDTHGRPAWIQTTEKCRHFNGLMNDTCRAGVEYATVRDEQSPRGYPCWIGPFHSVAEKTCALAEFPTEEEAKARLEEARAHMVAFFKEIEAGQCPYCHRPMRKQQVSRCVYAEPCGHRLYQGTC